MNCGKCDNKIIPDISHSVVILLQKLTPEQYLFFQCEDGPEFQGHTYQHYHCSVDCLKIGLAECIFDHYLEEKLHPIPLGMGFTTLHRRVLANKDLKCLHCDKPLYMRQAYRFCLTRALPIFEDIHSHEDFKEWHCSIECARERACDIIADIKDVEISGNQLPPGDVNVSYTIIRPDSQSQWDNSHQGS